MDNMNSKEAELINKLNKHYNQMLNNDYYRTFIKEKKRHEMINLVSTSFLSASNDNTIRLWDTESGECIRLLQGHSLGVLTASFSPDGLKVVSSSWDKTLRIWDALTGESLHELKGHHEGVHSACFSPDGTRVLSFSMDNFVRLWDVETGVKLVELVGHNYFLNSNVFSPDSSRLLSVLDNTI
mmetsp:Transcript_60446/g.51173  ORF Transcript_60446/g.51173 Transcript_60446/m.51173 type:complete len:183 (+) Transcript_60446:92-640(+)